MAARQKPGKRERLIQSAQSLVYRQGFNETRLGDIATDADVPPGNVYYYFKTKEEIGAAIIDEQLSTMAALLKRLEALGSPEERLCAFIQMTIDNRKMLARGGCPTGTLCTELHKGNTPLAKRSALLFEELLKWMTAQFKVLVKGEDAQGMAVHLLSALQGVAVLAHTLSDPEVVVMEAERLKQWVHTSAMKRGKE